MMLSILEAGLLFFQSMASTHFFSAFCLRLGGPDMWLGILKLDNAGSQQRPPN
uniref:Uncharacterized protein n=1 Tax=Arundo donax TaxID=35708 RepID=A0A0A8YK08_ARUDO